MLDKVRKPDIQQKRNRGYDLPAGTPLDREVAALSKTNVTKSALYALSFHARLVGPWLIVLLTASQYPAVLCIAPILWVWTASCQRALENLVHDGAHFNWSRKNEHINDLYVNVLAAWPVFLDVRAYRPPHYLHHRLFDTDQDPCRSRVIMQALRRRPGDTLVGRVSRLAPHLWTLNSEFFRTQLAAQDHRRLEIYVLWHTIAYVLPLTLVLGPTMAVLIWGLAWLTPQIFVLPIIRTLAEADEHDYDRPGTELDATFTNDGIASRWLIHPAGDAYHAAHHLRMGVPAYRMKTLDRLLRGSRSYAVHNRRA